MHPATIVFAFAALAAGAVANDQDLRGYGNNLGPVRRPTPSPQELQAARDKHLAAHEQVVKAHLEVLNAARQRARANPDFHIDGPSPQREDGSRRPRVNDGHISGAPFKSAYAVADQLTGDRKSVAVVSEGDVTKGSYSVVDPDGVTRTVNYIVTPQGGFQAQVLRDGVPVNIGADAGYGAAPQGVPRVNYGGNSNNGGYGGPGPQGGQRANNNIGSGGGRPRANAGQGLGQGQGAPIRAQQIVQQQQQPLPARFGLADNPAYQARQVTWTREVDADNDRERAEHLAEHARVTAARLQALEQANARAGNDENDYGGPLDANLYG